MTALGRFDPVTLDGLVAEASLLTRVDRKYVLPRAGLDAVIGALDPHTKVLEIDGARAFAYESVYFDTPDLLSFRMAAQQARPAIARQAGMQRRQAGGVFADGRGAVAGAPQRAVDARGAGARLGLDDRHRGQREAVAVGLDPL